MAATMRKAMTNFTNVVFPVSKDPGDARERLMMREGSEYVSSLPLQMFVYFNGFYSPFWVATSWVMFATKFTSLEILHMIMVGSVLVVMMIIEVIRLYLGYTGNLTEKVPEIAGFWLLTILLQFPLSLFLLIYDAKTLPMERAIHTVLVLFIVFEMFFGYFAIRTLVNHQVNKFHLKQFTDLEQIDTFDLTENLRPKEE